MTTKGAMEVSRLSAKGQVTVPKRIREQLNLNEGDGVAFLEDDGKITIIKASTITFNRIADEISSIVAEKGITEEELLGDLKRVRKDLWNERYNK
jgi:antitoxin PrlF